MFQTERYSKFVFLGCCVLAPTLCQADSVFSDVNTLQEMVNEVANSDDRADNYHSPIGQLTYQLDSSRLDEAAFFTSQILRLLISAGHDGTSDHWKPFVSRISIPKEEYHTSYWWKMMKELKKPVPRRVRATTTLESIYQRTKRFAVTNARKNRYWRTVLMDHEENKKR